MMRTILFTILAFALAAAAFGCNKGKSSQSSTQTQKVGGCEVETIAIGAGTAGYDEAPSDAAWIRLGSIEFAGNELYTQAAADLKKAIGARGVKIYGCTELTHIKEGPCWPPYSIECRIALVEQAGGHLRTFLQQNALAGCRPLAERPEGYGTFFVTCGFGSSDWWTVWYQK
jgi:hypothetical protein